MGENHVKHSWSIPRRRGQNAIVNGQTLKSQCRVRWSVIRAAIIKRRGLGFNELSLWTDKSGKSTHRSNCPCQWSRAQWALWTRAKVFVSFLKVFFNFKYNSARDHRVVVAVVDARVNENASVIMMINIISRLELSINWSMMMMTRLKSVSCTSPRCPCSYRALPFFKANLYLWKWEIGQCYPFKLRS